MDQGRKTKCSQRLQDQSKWGKMFSIILSGTPGTDPRIRPFVRALASAGPDPQIGVMIETDWGKPLHIAVTPAGDIRKISTIEQARYWLRKDWPVDDKARHRALECIDSAMHCLSGAASARLAFMAAATSAGFSPVAARS